MYICHWKNKKQPMIRKLLSLPPNLVESFHDLENASREEWFCTSDPVGSKLGSGGGTAWLLESCRKEENNYTERKAWLAAENGFCYMQADKAGDCRVMPRLVKY